MVSVNKECCIGCGSCVATCPEVFEMGDDQKAKVKADAKADAECIQKAVQDCPNQCISA